MQLLYLDVLPLYHVLCEPQLALGSLEVNTSSLLLLLQLPPLQDLIAQLNSDSLQSLLHLSHGVLDLSGLLLQCPHVRRVFTRAFQRRRKLQAHAEVRLLESGCRTCRRNAGILLPGLLGQLRIALALFGNLRIKLVEESTLRQFPW